MIHDIRQVFLANLEKVEWMDEKTKQKAKDKVLNSATFHFSSSLNENFIGVKLSDEFRAEVLAVCHVLCS